MIRNCCFIFLLFAYSTVQAQQPVLQWARQFGTPDWLSGTAYNNPRSISVDAQGNVYSAGLFFYYLDFDPGPGVANVTAQGPFNMGVYISKLNATGDYVWAKQLPLHIEGYIYMTTDPEGNVYLTTELRQAADMDPGPGVFMMTPIGAKDAVVIKLDTNGNFLWAKQFGGSLWDTVVSGTAMTVDKSGNVVVCGYFNHSVDFDPGAGQYTISGIGTFESFIVKLNSNGEFVWAGRFGNSNSVFQNTVIEDVACDAAGNIYTTGYFKGSCDFDPGPGSFVFTSTSSADGYVCKLDAAGNFVWAKRVGSSIMGDIVFPSALAVDQHNNVCISGSYFGTQDFDPGSGVYNLVSKGISDAFLLKLDEQGNFAWAKSVGSTSDDRFKDIAIDNTDSIYVIGSVIGAVDLDPGPGVYQVNTNGGLVVSKFGADGNFKYGLLFQGYLEPRSLATDAAHNIYFTGPFSSSVDFDPGPGIYNLTAGPNRSELFVAKLAKCLNQTSATLDVRSCSTYRLNSISYDSSGTYTQIIQNAAGCDSIITLNLTISKKFVSQNKSICEGDTFYAGGGMQTKPGVYIDTLQSTLGCDSIVTTMLTVHPKPKPNLGPDRNLCSDSTLTMSPGLFAGYLWQDSTTQSSFRIHSGGLYWVRVMDAYQCTASDSITITSVARPNQFLKTTDSICSYGTLYMEPLVPFSTYSWSTGETAAKINVNSPGQYWLQVTDDNHCTGRDTIDVVLKDCMKGIYVPTAFSPNNDGKNDTFKPLLFGDVKEYHLTVFNRWGEKVFETSDHLKGWDGRVQAREQDSNVYVWICTYRLGNEERKVAKGSFVLLR